MSKAADDIVNFDPNSNSIKKLYKTNYNLFVYLSIMTDPTFSFILDEPYQFSFDYKFIANTENAEFSESMLNKHINKFIDLDTFRKENVNYFKDILSESTLGILPSTGIFSNVLKNYNDIDNFQFKNRRLLTTTNTLVLPTIYLLNF